MSLQEYLDGLVRCPSLEALWDLHTQKMAEYGFDRLIYGYTRYRTSTSLGDPEDFIILTNHCRSYTDEFLGAGLYYDAPMVHWALANDGACSWTVMHEMAQAKGMTPAVERVLDFNRRMGVHAGYTVSFKSISARSKGAIALTARRDLDQAAIDAVWAEHGDDIKVMNDVAHLKILTLPQNTAKHALTPRQREALQWVGDGKTTQDIALLMGLTAATVEKHLRLARESMGVETTAQAVLKAAFTNQMFVMDV
ncbi:LuxR family transcriptional regulator [Sulfitobacter mediterraneus]|jgi:LuxR family transcriptional regulator, quorum-sensing system regulator SdiA|uniref:LuxR family transcriptional regulator n=1 Tax=Sulfitobacter TaxID=60136 RepID=UPI0019336C49|nr:MULTISPECIES: LuxR family transcriptional regulator [Sulfitobacter]MBM1632099.1 LuxR family transcriptional regulator [Sulfitobacter mediterraneus]MBM1639914.1 LuxR family transcriptional regulator [Sulfitobacter mediterraneus]MBM1643963.1 LuxR family transcriptional regulator [Sulfitobacter mediterraneus]MBM1648009.1 LuxR family transcriptional regulator [Sulfitobacter mediterraneus]MBM1652054.1 LuxR family transcriptional regulator [Sulfitobacter mediterraneus]